MPHHSAHDPELHDVLEFHIKFNQLNHPTPTHLTRRKLAERANFLLEELKEFGQAAGLELTCNLEKGHIEFTVDEHGSQDLALQADALVDLVYVAKGTAVMLGLPWVDLWDDVQRANLAKVLGMTHRGYLMDVTKPAGWEPPHTAAILHAWGYRFEKFALAPLDDQDNLIIIADELCADDAVHQVP